MGTLAAMAAFVIVFGAIKLNEAKQKARQISAYGRLSQMRLALLLYEDEHGSLPPPTLRDEQGNPSHSWRTLILPYLGGHKFPPIPDLTQPWDSAINRNLIDGIPIDRWVWFNGGHTTISSPPATHILAYVDSNTNWVASSNLPSEATNQPPAAVLLIWVPTSNVHPLQPGDITELEVRQRVEAGEELLFIAAGEGSSYGLVSIEAGKLVFRDRTGVEH